MANRPKYREILRTMAGSTLHGVAIPGQDDRDEMGIAIESPEFVIGLGRWEQDTFRTQPEGVRSGPGDLDLVIYSLRKWARLAAHGHPTMLLPLFAPQSMILRATGAGHSLRQAHKLFVTREAGERFLGYLNNQRSQLVGRRGGAPKRPELVERHGFDTKFAMHAVRLAYQGCDLMETGSIELPMPEDQQAWCMRIRHGEVTKKTVLSHLRFLEERLVRSMENSKLPARPDLHAINLLLIRLYSKEWKLYIAEEGPIENPVTDEAVDEGGRNSTRRVHRRKSASTDDNTSPICTSLFHNGPQQHQGDDHDREEDNDNASAHDDQALDNDRTTEDVSAGNDQATDSSDSEPASIDRKDTTDQAGPNSTTDVKVTASEAATGENATEDARQYLPDIRRWS